MDLKKLLEPMPYKTRQWPWGKQLAYIDARDAQDRLDEVCWPNNWKVDYKEAWGMLFAWVSIKIDNEWITKWDWGSESNIEKEKGLISDSFKRACVAWWIGRFLYSLDSKKTTTTQQPQEKKNWLNYEQFVEIVEAWNTTEADLTKIFKEENYTLSQYAKKAVRHYVETGELEKNLFYKQP